MNYLSPCDYINVNPKISVVIPTYNRPDLLIRAVQSVVNQTFVDFEVIIVLDGPDKITENILQNIVDARIKLLKLAHSVGGADARNAGVRAALGKWVAFLDDDDEWFAEKLKTQIDAAIHLNSEYPIIFSRVIARTPNGDYVWPRRLPKNSESAGDYLFTRNSLFNGEALLHTSTIFTKKELLIAVPFKSGLIRHQDWDWVLSATQTKGVCLEVIPEPLAIWYYGDNRKRISSQNNWEFSLEWIYGKKALISPQAYSSFLLIIIGSQAASFSEWKAFKVLLLSAIRYGAPRPIDYMLYFVAWFVPKKLRLFLKILLVRKSY